VDKNGVYGHILKIDLLPSNVRAYGFDPAQKELVSVTSEDLTQVDDAFEIAGDNRTFFGSERQFLRKKHTERHCSQERSAPKKI